MHVEQVSNKTLTRALRIIELLAHSKKPMQLQGIAEKTGIPESSVLRTLHTLILNKYAHQDTDTKKYFLTLKFSYIGDLISSQMSMRDMVKPYLVTLSEECGESACLAIERDYTAVYIDFVEGPNSLLKTLHHIGRTAPLHCTGVGKCLLLNYSADSIDRYIEKKGLRPFTGNSIREKPQLIREIEKVRSQGYAIDDEECEQGVRCVAAPITDYMEKIIASVSITGPSSRLTKDRIETIKDRVIDAARSISEKYYSFKKWQGI